MIKQEEEPNEDKQQSDVVVSPFDAIRHVNKQGNEYWSARELARILGYNDYRNFQDVIKRARAACEQSKYSVSDHFGESTDMVTIGSGAREEYSTTSARRTPPT